MRKFLTGLVAAGALVGLAACGDADDTTTQTIEPEEEVIVPEEDPATDDSATQGLETEPGTADQ